MPHARGCCCERLELKWANGLRLRNLQHRQITNSMAGGTIRRACTPANRTGAQTSNAIEDPLPYINIKHLLASRMLLRYHIRDTGTKRSLVMGHDCSNNPAFGRVTMSYQSMRTTNSLNTGQHCNHSSSSHIISLFSVAFRSSPWAKAG